MSSTIIAFVGMGVSFLMAVLIGALLMLNKKAPISPSPDPAGQTAGSTVDSLTAFTPGQKVTITHGGKMLGHKLNSGNNKDNVCDIAYPASTGTFLLDKVSNGFSMTVNCDGNEKWLSFVADDASDMVQPVRNLKKGSNKPAWLITCPSATQGCSIQASKSKKYISPSTSGVTLAATPAYWIFANA